MAVAPVVLFVYNRPYHTEKTLAALEQNLLAQETELYIYSDGAKNEKSRSAVAEVRQVIRKAWKLRKVTIIERESNWGLANNVINGVTDVIARHGAAIVIEDDVLLSAYTLTYFNDGLRLYRDEEKIMHIGSYMYNIDRKGLPDTFFTRSVSSQAWATWDRAWRWFEPDIEKLIAQFDKPKIAAFTFDHSMNYWRQINEQRGGKIDSWAIRWYASVFLKKGLALQTSMSMIDNIGHDGSGVHSSISSMFETEVKKDKVTYFPTVLEEDPVAFKALKNYFKHRKGNLLQRGYRFLYNKIFKLLK